jgi:hypothetical protein
MRASRASFAFFSHPTLTQTLSRRFLGQSDSFISTGGVIALDAPCASLSPWCWDSATAYLMMWVINKVRVSVLT